MSTANAIEIVTSGGEATASNPPLQVTLWKKNGSGAYEQVTDVGGGGGVKKVAGVSPDGAGNVPLTHASLGPILVSDLGFDPETQAEFDAALVTIGQQIAAAGKFKGPYSATKAYAVGDAAVYQGDIYQATTAISVSSGVQYVGTGKASSSTNVTSLVVPIPAGAQAGDLAILFVTPGNTGWSVAAGPTLLNSYLFSRLYSRVLAAGDITNGSFTFSGSSGKAAGMVRVYRGAGTPAAANFVEANLGAGAYRDAPARTIGNDSAYLRVAGNASLTTSPTVVGADVESTSVGMTMAHLLGAGPNIAANANAYRNADASLAGSFATAEIEIPAAAGFNPTQWTNLTRTAAKRVAVANVNYAADGSETSIVYTSLTTARSVTLPLAASVPAGREITVLNATASSQNISVNRAGADTINGGTVTTIQAARTGVVLVSDGVSAWDVVVDSFTTASLAGKLDNAANSVSVANLVDAAKPAIGRDSSTGGSSLTGGESQRAIVLTADTAISLPTTAAFGTARFFLIRTSGAFTLTLNRASTDTIGVSAATSLAIPPSIAFTLLRSDGAGRWDVLAGAGVAGDPGKVDTTSAASRVFGTDSGGVQATYPVGQNTSPAGSIVQRKTGGRIGAGPGTIAGEATTVEQVDLRQAGQIAAPAGSYGSSFIASANLVRIVRFVAFRAMAIPFMAFGISTPGSADDLIDVGIYDSALNRLGSSGPVAAQVNGTAGARKVALTSTVNLTAGQVYYAALAYGAVGGTAATLATINTSGAAGATLFGTTAGPAELMLGTATGGVLASSLVGMSAGTGTGFLLAVRES